MCMSPSAIHRYIRSLCLCLLDVNIYQSCLTLSLPHWEERERASREYCGLFRIFPKLEGTGLLQREQIIALVLLHKQSGKEKLNLRVLLYSSYFELIAEIKAYQILYDNFVKGMFLIEYNYIGYEKSLIFTILI